jgi:hypothetical protein
MHMRVPCDRSLLKYLFQDLTAIFPMVNDMSVDSEVSVVISSMSKSADSVSRVC